MKIHRSEELPPKGPSFSVIRQGRLWRRRETASLDLVLKDKPLMRERDLPAPAPSLPARRQLLGLGAAAGVAALAGLPRLGRAATIERQAVIYNGFPAGDMMDTIARMFAEGMTGVYADKVIVENRPGAGGRLGVTALQAARPDGSHMLFTPASMIVLYPHVFKALPYDSLKDLQPVSRTASACFSLAVGPMVPESVKTLAQYLDWCRKNPEKANYATSGAGSSIHLTGANLVRLSGVPQTMVPYKGGSPAAADMVGGQVAALMSTLPSVIEYARAGRCRVLAVSSPERWPSMPAVPTFAESGFPDLTYLEWFGVFMPAGSPMDKVQAANRAIQEAARNPKIVDTLQRIAIQVETSSVADFTRDVRDNHAHWAQVVKAVGFNPME